MTDAQRVTKGPWRADRCLDKFPGQLDDPGYHQIVTHIDGKRVVVADTLNRDSRFGPGEDEKHATLIAEAGTVLHETGATPRQILDGFKASIASNADLVKERASLQRRVEELTEALKRASSLIDRIYESGPDCDCEPEGHVCGWPELRRVREQNRAALASDSKEGR